MHSEMEEDKEYALCGDFEHGFHDLYGCVLRDTWHHEYMAERYGKRWSWSHRGAWLRVGQRPQTALGRYPISKSLAHFVQKGRGSWLSPAQRLQSCTNKIVSVGHLPNIEPPHSFVLDVPLQEALQAARACNVA